ncbi:MAG: hypothetical protein ACR2L2_01370 [Acidobacteriota bacterium]
MRKKQSKSTGTKKGKTRDSWVNKGVVVDPQRTQPPEGPRVSDGYGGAQGSQGREGQDRDGGGDKKS